MKHVKGFTLVELMVSITIGILVLAGAVQFYLNVFRSNADGVLLQRFEQTVHVLAETMVSDLRRAGYEYKDIATGTTVTLTPQSNGRFFSAENLGKCVLFNYSNKDPSDNVWKQYFYGYQLYKQRIYYYESNAANGNCDFSGWVPSSDEDSFNNWVPLTNTSQIIFTNTDAQPVFVQTNPAIPLVDINVIAQAVGLTAQGGGAVTRNLSVSVRVRNG